jgi:hypothetical protein
MSSSPIAISPERQAQVSKTVTEWYKNFEGTFDDQFTRETFKSTYHASIEWYDHAFHIRRVGHEAVLGLRTAWLHCNQPFRSELKVNCHFATPRLYNMLTGDIAVGSDSNSRGCCGGIGLDRTLD